MQAAMYLRQSQDRDNNQLAITRQREDCERLCQSRGWTPVPYPDNDTSASSGTRPAYQRMLTDIRAGKVGAVVCWDLDRLHRRPIELEEFITLADQKSLALATVTGEVDLSTDNGRLFARIKGAVARSEVERKSARQKRSSTQRAQSGVPWWPSRPFGYDADRGPDGKWTSKNPIRLHPAEAPLLAKAYSDILAGTALHSIATAWNDAGITTPRSSIWRGAQVRQVLINARNAGIIENRGEVVGQGTWPAIVGEDVYRGVVAVLSSPGRRHGKALGRKYLLSGIAVCGECGAPLGSTIVRSTGAGNYICKQCFGVSRNIKKVDAMVIESVVQRLSRDDAEDLMSDRDAPDLDALRVQRTALNERLAELGREYGRKPAAFIDAAVDSITTQLEEIKLTLTDADKAHIFEGATGSDADEKFDKLDLDRQRAIVAALVTVTINPTRKGAGFDRNSVAVVFRDES